MSFSEKPKHLSNMPSHFLKFEFGKLRLIEIFLCYVKPYIKPFFLHLQFFTGKKKDGSSIHQNEVPLPTVASSIVIMETISHNNSALRMELFGCEPGGYI